MRSIMATTTVTLAPNGNPKTILWPTPGDTGRARTSPRRRQVITVIDSWQYDGHWWERQPIHRDYYLLELDGGTQAEIFREQDTWWVARISD